MFGPNTPETSRLVSQAVKNLNIERRNQYSGKKVPKCICCIEITAQKYPKRSSVLEIKVKSQIRNCTAI